MARMGGEGLPLMGSPASQTDLARALNIQVNTPGLQLGDSDRLLRTVDGIPKDVHVVAFADSWVVDEGSEVGDEVVVGPNLN